jgi:peptidoglycan/LPS O-acetylase OafA/YrhL
LIFQDNSHERMPQLDSLRAFAIGGVMIAHSAVGFTAVRYLPFELGVQLFFVLSGFLITRILLRGTPTAAFVGGFYIRRALRLLPLYYLVLAIVAIFSAEVRDAWVYYSFYGANFWVAANMRWGTLTHFWTLAVEEQFYIIWPFVVLFCSRRILASVCVFLILAAPVFRFATSSNPFASVLLPGQFDFLACGSMLAVIGPQRLTLSRLIVASLSLALTLAVRMIHIPILSALHLTLSLPFLYYLVSGAACDFRGVVGVILSSRALRYIGQISYGLYVIHWPIYLWLTPYFTRSTSHRTIASIIAVGVTIALASLSWRYFEGPINQLRGAVVDVLFGQRLRHPIADVVGSRIAPKPRPRNSAVAREETKVAQFIRERDEVLHRQTNTAIENTAAGFAPDDTAQAKLDKLGEHCASRSDL